MGGLNSDATGWPWAVAGRGGGGQVRPCVWRRDDGDDEWRRPVACGPAGGWRFSFFLFHAGGMIDYPVRSACSHAKILIFADIRVLAGQTTARKKGYARTET